MNDQAKAVSRPWRRFLRFSVRGLIVVVLVVGGWLGWIVRSARIQREAIAGIKEDGGSTYYDRAFYLQMRFDHGSYLQYGEFSSGSVWPPKWLVDAIGVDYFANVAQVFIRHPSDAVLSHVEKLGKVRAISIIEIKEMSDASLSHFNTQSHLLGLNLLGAHQVGDAGVLHLKNLTSLKVLDLSSTRVSDAGLVHLARLTKLSWLSLGSTLVTDAGLKHLTLLNNLSTLDVRGTKVTEAGVKELQQALPNLNILR